MSRLRSVGIVAACLALGVAGCCGARARASRHKPLLPLAASSASSASPSSASALAGETFRNSPPTPGPVVRFVPPAIQETRLPNGVRVLVVEQHDLPIVAVHIAIDRGADQARPGVGAFAGATLLAGTRTRSALQISDSLLDLGAVYGSLVDYDGAHVEGQVLKPKLSSLLELLGDVVQNPAFSAAEVDRERARRLTALAQENDSPKTLMMKAAMQALFPTDHPYHALLLGDEKGLTALTRADLLRFYQQTFRPSHMTIALAGDITQPEAVAELTKVFGEWKGARVAPTTPPAPPAPSEKTARLLVIDRRGATQSQVAVLLPGIARKHPDYDAVVVMNHVLGGQFSSRINLNLREKHSYSYGAYSGFDFRHGPGPFVASGAVVRESTAEAIGEILAETTRMRTELVTEEELEDAKTSLVQKLPGRFQTVDATAESMAALAVYDLPLDEFATKPDRINAITREDVKRVAEKYLRADETRVVVVGDLGVIEPKLAKLAAVQGLKMEVQKTPSAAADREAPKPRAPRPPKT